MQTMAFFEGKPVFYNQPIHLVHAQSNFFLDSFSESTEYHSFSINLSEHSSKSSLFLIVPLYNTMSMSDKVQTSDQFRIKNIKTSYYLSFTTTKGYISFQELNASQGFAKDKTVFDMSQGNDDLNTCSVILTEQGLVWNCKLIRRQSSHLSDIITSNELCRIVFPHFGSELTCDYSYLVKHFDFVG
jgi:hypothetical protein